MPDILPNPMPLDSHAFEIAAPDVVAEDFGSEVVVLNLANGRYFSLLGVAADLWRDIVAGHRPRDLIGHLLARNSASAEAVRLYLLALLNESLIRPIQVSREIPPVEQATGIVALDSGAEPPMLEIFDDMADLLLCDPIHDVDEDIGWPVKRTPV
ncbi:MAG: hypothetical protein IPG66_01315 [Hydrogenophilales bacterium]|nr:hypothetical protein [Hydrogenophilales bacterium]